MSVLVSARATLELRLASPTSLQSLILGLWLASEHRQSALLLRHHWHAFLPRPRQYALWYSRALLWSRAVHTCTCHLFYAAPLPNYRTLPSAPFHSDSPMFHSPFVTAVLLKRCSSLSFHHHEWLPPSLELHSSMSGSAATLGMLPARLAASLSKATPAGLACAAFCTAGAPCAAGASGAHTWQGSRGGGV